MLPHSVRGLALRERVEAQPQVEEAESRQEVWLGLKTYKAHP